MLVDFWTYTCINCIRTLPYVRAWDERYRRRGLTVVGVHTPEFPFERDAGNVQRAIAQNGLRYPVAQDNDYATWNAWGNQYWPAKYLIDARGRVRYAHFGEGDYDADRAAIRALLAEAGAARLGARGPGARGGAVARAARRRRPTSDYERAQGVRHAAAPRPGPLRRHDGPGARATSRSSGTWKVTTESATAVRDAAINARFDRPPGVPRAGHVRRAPRARRRCCSTATRWPRARRART